LALALAVVAAVLMCWILSIEEAFRLAPLTGLAVFLRFTKQFKEKLLSLYPKFTSSELIHITCNSVCL
jgi:hypothetical protein